MTVDDTTYITTEELAKLCRTSPSTCRYWRSIDYGPKGKRVGRRVLYPLAAVLAWLDESDRA